MNFLRLILFPVLIAGFALTVSAQTATELKIKKLSEFDARAAARDPFWPVGWKPGVQAAAGADLSGGVTVLKPESFVVTSISTGALPLAVINGRAYGEGELIPLDAGGSRKVQVYAIRDGVVVLRYQNQTITAYIRQKQ